MRRHNEDIAYAETIKRLSVFNGDAVIAILSAVVADALLQLSAEHGITDAAKAKKLYKGIFTKSVVSAYPVVGKMHELSLMAEASRETKQ